jgi:signal transduction histidine kinase
VRTGSVARKCPGPVPTSIVVVPGILLGAIAVALRAHGSTHALPEVAVNGITGFLFLGAGAAARERRPASRVGVLMMLVGAGWFAEDLHYARSPIVFTVGMLTSHAAGGFAAHLVCAFPVGRLTSWVQRLLVASAYAVTFGLVALAVMAYNSTSHGYPENLILVDADLTVVHGVMCAVDRSGMVIATGVLAVLLRRWARATRPMRRVLLPIFVAGLIGSIGSFWGDLAYHSVYGRAGHIVYDTAFGLLPIGFLAGLLPITVGRTGIDALLTDLTQIRSAETMHYLLVRALGDPSLEIGYARPDTDLFADIDGRPLPLPVEGSRRSATFVESDGDRIAVLVHDEAVTEDRRRLETVTVAASLAIAKQRLADEVRGQLAEVQMSRARIVAAADAERRRVERDLHDGAQQRLVLTAMTLREAAERLGGNGGPDVARLLAATVDGLEAALAELRELARGIHPAILADAGLVPAIESLVQRMPMPVELVLPPIPRLSERSETAVFYTVAEALTNAAKHASAARVRITVRHTHAVLVVEVSDDGVGGAAIGAGSGLLGLRDRMLALGGELAVYSPPGRGTTIRAVLPCPGTSATAGR